MKVILIILCVIGGLFVIGALVVIYLVRKIKKDVQNINYVEPWFDDEDNEYFL